MKIKILELKRYIIIILFISNCINSMYAERIPKNVLGKDLQKCVDGTGFYRDGFCNTGPDDYGTHVVCAEVTQKFLIYSQSQGNDLITTKSYFPGLKEGDRWCLCGFRFEQARKAGFAPKIIPESTQSKALEYTTLEELKKYFKQ